MKKGERHFAGFTIVEVLIVLSISSAILIAAIVALSGSQNEKEFQASIQQVVQQVQQAIVNVETGDYSQNQTLGQAQGTDNSHIFLGEALQFQVNGKKNNEEIRQYTVVGCRNIGCTPASQLSSQYCSYNPVTCPSGAGAALSFANNGAGTSEYQDYGLYTDHMWFCPSSIITGQLPNCGSRTYIGGVAILESLNATSGGGNLASGQAKLVSVPILLNNLGAAPASCSGLTPLTCNLTGASIDTSLSSSPTLSIGACALGISAADDFAQCQPDSIYWCFVSYTTGQSANVYTTVREGAVSVGYKIYSTNNCNGND